MEEYDEPMFNLRQDTLDLRQLTYNNYQLGKFKCLNSQSEKIYEK